ncbi:MAG: putative metal ion transport protein, partial [uncultured Actinomycetospora sp.]
DRSGDAGRRDRGRAGAPPALEHRRPGHRRRGHRRGRRRPRRHARRRLRVRLHAAVGGGARRRRQDRAGRGGGTLAPRHRLDDLRGLALARALDDGVLRRLRRDLGVRLRRDGHDVVSAAAGGDVRRLDPGVGHPVRAARAGARVVRLVPSLREDHDGAGRRHVRRRGGPRDPRAARRPGDAGGPAPDAARRLGDLHTGPGRRRRRHGDHGRVRLLGQRQGLARQLDADHAPRQPRRLHHHRHLRRRHARGRRRAAVHGEHRAGRERPRPARPRRDPRPALRPRDRHAVPRRLLRDVVLVAARGVAGREPVGHRLRPHPPRGRRPHPGGARRRRAALRGRHPQPPVPGLSAVADVPADGAALPRAPVRPRGGVRRARGVLHAVPRRDAALAAGRAPDARRVAQRVALDDPARRVGAAVLRAVRVGAGRPVRL